MDCINLAFGEVHFPTPQVICETMAKYVRNGQLRYSIPQGEPDLLKVLSCCISREENVTCLSENLIIVPGAKQGIKYIFDLLDLKGKRVAIFEPTWQYYIELLEFVGAEVYRIRFEEEWPSQIALLEELYAIIIINPNNPDGRVWKARELYKLKEICERKDAFLVCDEVYKNFVYIDRYSTFLRMSKGICDKVVIIRSFSKSFAMAGARVGYIIAEKSIIKKICKLQSMYINNVPAFIQKGCYVGLLNRTSFQPQMRDYYYKNMLYMYNVLINTKYFMPTRPDGGLCMIVDVSGWADSVEQASEYLYKKGILCSGVWGHSEFNGRRYVRLSFCHDRSTIKQAMQLIQKIDNDLVESKDER